MDFIENKLYIKALDNLETGIHILDSRGNTIYYNNAASAIDGISKEEIFKKNMNSLIEEGLFSASIGLEVLKEKQVIKKFKKLNINQFYLEVYHILKIILLNM